MRVLDCFSQKSRLLVMLLCDLPGRVGGARFTQSPAGVLARLLVQHPAKIGPLTVTCQEVSYLNNEQVKQLDHWHWQGSHQSL